MINATLYPRFLIASGALSLAACATVPPPPADAFQAADIALANAEKDRAVDYAPLEMKAARDKLAAARLKVEKPDEHNVVESRRLADEARADADLAIAKARLAKAEAVNVELQKNADRLRQEAQRGSGV